MSCDVGEVTKLENEQSSFSNLSFAGKPRSNLSTEGYIVQTSLSDIKNVIGRGEKFTTSWKYMYCWRIRFSANICMR